VRVYRGSSHVINGSLVFQMRIEKSGRRCCLSLRFPRIDAKGQKMSFKNGMPSWEDLRLFLAVANEGGLIGAAAVSASTPPTLSRRMRHLEDNLGIQLFERHQTGYSLTQHGRELLVKVQEMETHSNSIQTWRAQLDQRPVVRITAGSWTSVFLAQHLEEITGGARGPRIEFLSGASFLSVSRREADIAIRNKIPEQQGIAKTRIGPVSFGIYGSSTYCRSNPSSQSQDRYENCDWVILSAVGATGTSSSWLRQRIGDSARLVCDTPHAVLEAAPNGVGLCVLPRFVGEQEPRLQACCAEIDCLRHTQWLVTHDETGTLSHVRKTAKKIVKLIAHHQDLFGEANL